MRQKFLFTTTSLLFLLLLRMGAALETVGAAPLTLEQSESIAAGVPVQSGTQTIEASVLVTWKYGDR